MFKNAYAIATDALADLLASRLLAQKIEPVEGDERCVECRPAAPFIPLEKVELRGGLAKGAGHVSGPCCSCDKLGKRGLALLQKDVWKVHLHLRRDAAPLPVVDTLSAKAQQLCKLGDAVLVDQVFVGHNPY